MYNIFVYLKNIYIKLPLYLFIYSEVEIISSSLIINFFR